MCAYGQDNTRSQKIIDDMIAKFKTYPSVSINFSATTTQLQDKSEVDYEGKLWLKGNRYKLEIPDYVLYFDGSKNYLYYPEVNEVNITKPDPDEDDEDFQLMNPQALFNLSSKNFKSTLVKESTQNGRRVYEIDLYPIQLKTTKYSRIRTMVEKSTLQLVYLKAFLKDGTQHTISFKPFDIHQTALRDSFFTFNRLEHPNVEMIDLTF
jgi:outer membrane lipoprotein-sorting protein